MVGKPPAQFNGIAQIQVGYRYTRSANTARIVLHNHIFIEFSRQSTSVGFINLPTMGPSAALPPGLGKRAAMLFLRDEAVAKRGAFRFFSIFGGAVSAAVRAGGG
jgi:hypothetical protein